MIKTRLIPILLRFETRDGKILSFKAHKCVILKKTEEKVTKEKKKKREKRKKRYRKSYHPVI